MCILSVLQIKQVVAPTVNLHLKKLSLFKISFNTAEVSFHYIQIIFTVTHVQHFIQVSHMSPLSYDKPLLVICPILGSLQQLLENVYMKFYILKRSLFLGMNLCRFSSRGRNDQGTK
jgi:hypothetical protein